MSDSVEAFSDSLLDLRGVDDELEDAIGLFISLGSVSVFLYAEE